MPKNSYIRKIVFTIIWKYMYSYNPVPWQIRCIWVFQLNVILDSIIKIFVDMCACNIQIPQVSTASVYIYILLLWEHLFHSTASSNTTTTIIHGSGRLWYLTLESVVKVSSCDNIKLPRLPCSSNLHDFHDHLRLRKTTL